MASFQLYDPDIAYRDVSVVQSQVSTGIEGSGLLWCAVVQIRMTHRCSSIIPKLRQVSQPMLNKVWLNIPTARPS